jgi:hypothetical protein
MKTPKNTIHKQHNVALARGGKGRDRHMLPQQSSETAPKGRTADPTAADHIPGKRLIKKDLPYGGPSKPTPEAGTGNVAKPGRTGNTIEAARNTDWFKR